MSAITSPTIDSVHQERNNALPPDLLKEKTAKNLLWVGIISIIMMFGGLTSAVIVSQGGNFWVNVKLPAAFWISSGLVLAGSLLLVMAKRAVAQNNLGQTKMLLTLTLLIGFGFGITQFWGYKQMVENGHFLTGKIIDPYTKTFIPKGEYGKDFTLSWKGEELKYENGIFYSSTGPLSEAAVLKLQGEDNTSSSFIYFLSFLHLLHLVGGVIYLMVVTTMAFRERFSPANHLKIKLCGIYWHFLALLWIYLFVFLQYIH